MMYAGSKNKLVHTVQLTKVCQLWPSSIIIIIIVIMFLLFMFLQL